MAAIQKLMKKKTFTLSNKVPCAHTVCTHLICTKHTHPPPLKQTTRHIRQVHTHNQLPQYLCTTEGEKDCDKYLQKVPLYPVFSSLGVHSSLSWCVLFVLLDIWMQVLAVCRSKVSKSSNFRSETEKKKIHWNSLVSLFLQAVMSGNF